MQKNVRRNDLPAAVINAHGSFISSLLFSEKWVKLGHEMVGRTTVNSGAISSVNHSSSMKTVQERCERVKY